VGSVQNEALLALELFQLDPRAKASKIVLHEHLAAVALLELNSPSIEKQILSKVIQLCADQCPLSKNELHQALERCVRQLTVNVNSDETYFLSPDTRKVLNSQLSKHQDQEKSFNHLIVSETEKSVNQTLSTLGEPMLINAVTKTLQTLFYDNHLRLQKALQQGSSFSSLLEVDFDPERYLRSELEVFIKNFLPDQMENTVKGIKNALANLQSDEQAYLLRLLQQVFFFEILNVDPRLKEIERHCFEQTRLYLDTNVGIRYITPYHSDYKTFKTIIDTSKALGCKITVSPATLGEMVNLVTNAKSYSAHLIQDKISYILRADPRAADNPLIETYISEKLSNKALNWPAFIARYDDVKTLLNARGINVEGDDATVLREDPNFKAVYKETSTVKEFAYPSVILHDTLNILLVHKLRQVIPPTPMGPGVWLLTMDHQLPKVDRMLHRLLKVGHCQMIDRWAEAVFPFQGIAGIPFNGDYVSFLVGNRFGIYIDQSTIDTKFLKTLTDDEIGFPELLDLPPEIVLGVIRTIQNDREARKLAEESVDVTTEDRENKRKQLMDLIAKYAAEIEAASKVKANNEIKTLRAGITKFKISLDEAKQQSNKDVSLIEGLESKINGLIQTLQQREDALAAKDNVLVKTQLELEATRTGSWMARVIRAMRGR